MPNSNDNPPSPRPPGVYEPNTFQCPNEIVDELLTELSGAELKVLLYIVRRTFGFQKQSDAISLSQMLTGITKHSGEVLDRGAGVSKPTLLQALRGLQEKHLIYAEQQNSPERGHEPTRYYLIRRGTFPSQESLLPLDKKLDQGGRQETLPSLDKKLDQGVGNETLPSPRSKNLTIQNSEVQNPVKQNRDSTYLRKVQTEREIGDNSEVPQSPVRPPQDDDDTYPPTSKKRSEREVQIARAGDYNYEEIVREDEERTESQALRNQRNPQNSQSSKNSAARQERGTINSSKEGFVQIGDLLGAAAKAQQADEIRQIITRFVSDFAEELHDQGPFSSSVTRAYNDLIKSGVDLDAFITLMYEARTVTQFNSASIKAKGQQGGKSKMGYWFGVLEKKLGLKANEYVPRGESSR